MKSLRSKPKKLSFYLWTGFVVFSITYISVTFWPISTAGKNLVLSPAYLIPPALAVLGCALAFLKTGRNEKMLWGSLTMANLLLLFGEIVWIYYTLFFHMAEPPYPSMADYAYLSGYLFLFIMLLSMARFTNTFNIRKVRYLLDIAVVMVISVVLVGLFLLKPIYMLYPDATLGEQVLNILYVVMDLGIVFGILVNVFGFKVSKWSKWEILIAASIILRTISDFIFGSMAGANAYEAGNIWANTLDVGWLTSYYLLFMAGLARSRTKNSAVDLSYLPKKEQVGLKWQDLFIPLAVLVIVPCFIFIAVYQTSDVFNRWTLIIAATVLSMLIVVRATVVTAENSALFANSVTDYITGLFNHRFFQEKADAEIRRAQRYNENLSIAILDIDDFGQVNDLFGHSAGDQTLREVAEIIRSHARLSDTVCRIGGDEFGVIMPMTNSMEAFQVCLRIGQEITNAEIFESKEVRVSSGISSFPYHAEDPGDLIRKADGALYWAKYHGKDQVFIFDADVVEALNAEERATRAEEQSLLNTVHALAAAVDARDPYTQFHSRHVAGLATSLAEKLGMEKKKVKLIEMAAMLHDIGKIGIPDKILKKQGLLTKNEREQIETHPKLTEKILASTSLAEILPWVISHHEKWDGKGYPQGLKGEEIPLEGRVLAICDAYDAMTSDRPYRKALTRETALEELHKGKGTQFDPNILEVFIQLLGQMDKLPVTTG